MLTIELSLPLDSKTSSAAGLAAWANAHHIRTDDGTIASAASITPGLSTIYLVAHQFAGFDVIPAGSDIHGIEVAVRRGSTQGRCRDAEVRLWQGDAALGDNKADLTAPWPATLTTKAYGGQNDPWGVADLADRVASPDFGVAVRSIKAVAGPGGSFVDYIKMKIWYTPPA